MTITLKIDDDLLAQAQAVTGITSSVELAETALKTLIKGKARNNSPS